MALDGGAAGTSGSAQLVAPLVAASDSQVDSLWLANHVDLPIVKLLDKVSGELQAMYAMSLRDGTPFAQMTLHNTSPLQTYLNDGTDPMMSVRTPDADDVASRLKAMGLTVTGQYDAGTTGSWTSTRRCRAFPRSLPCRG